MIVEDVKDDRENRSKARRVVDNTINFFSDSTIEDFGEVVYPYDATAGGKSFSGFRVDYNKIDTEFDETVYIFFNNQNLAGINNKDSNGDYVIWLPIPDGIDSDSDVSLIKQYIPYAYNEPAQRIIFIHEVVHLLDFIRSDDKIQGYDITDDVDKHYNSPLESNAYYQEAMDVIEKKYRSTIDRYETFPNFFLEVWHPAIFSKNFMDNVNPAVLLKIQKRLYKWYEDVRKESKDESVDYSSHILNMVERDNDGHFE